HATAEAFNLAERWQTPVFVLSDLLLSEHFETVDGLDLESVAIDRGALITNGSVPTPYLRYELTENGVSPRAIPGMAGAEHIAGSDEHDEDGTLVSDVRAGLPDAIEVRKLQMDKRMRKMQLAVADMRLPERIGPKNAPVTLVSWGSTQGAVREAMAMLRKQGVEVASIEFTDLWPLDAQKVGDLLRRESFTLMIEGNFTGQLERLIRAETGWFPNERLHKYDGEPFWPEEIVAKVQDILKSKPKEVRP
ncbi:MAG TPA: 2-oxoacid:acceptor oxidoreductase subunit alpha, partial [Candidatus Thermoplasmatota archaeon]|nr:2-oxoacid:acceptor oxidoreductase subunit alpha [Candidatus Thermoplasmatota archaeon]